eukprot:3410999-Amphidinium_carterae.1
MKAQLQAAQARIQEKLAEHDHHLHTNDAQPDCHHKNADEQQLFPFLPNSVVIWDLKANAPSKTGVLI